MKPSQADTPVPVTHAEFKTSTRVYESGHLFHAGKEVLIRHAGETYRLRVTRQNKLILTK